jgi:hypothetical protein
MSIEEFDKIIPVSPPTVNRNTNPTAHSNDVSMYKYDVFMVANHLNTFTPVGIAMIIVADVK